jgi:hypothetical protein
VRGVSSTGLRDLRHYRLASVLQVHRAAGCPGGQRCDRASGQQGREVVTQPRPRAALPLADRFPNLTKKLDDLGTKIEAVPGVVPAIAVADRMDKGATWLGQYRHIRDKAQERSVDAAKC